MQSNRMEPARYRDLVIVVSMPIDTIEYELWLVIATFERPILRLRSDMGPWMHTDRHPATTVHRVRLIYMDHIEHVSR